MNLEQILSETRILSRRLEIAKSMLWFWSGREAYRRSIHAAVCALDAVSTAVFETEGVDADGLVEEALDEARLAIDRLETLAQAAWRAKLMPSSN